MFDWNRTVCIWCFQTKQLEMKCWCFQCSGSEGKKEKKGSSLQEAKRRGRMERSREEEEEMSSRLKTLVSVFNRNYTEWYIFCNKAIFVLQKAARR